MKEITTRSQLREGNRPGEGKLWETGKPMNKNRIAGRHEATSWHNTAKSNGWVVEVNAAVVPGSNAFLPGETLDRAAGQRESAEVVVTSSKPGAEKCPL